MIDILLLDNKSAILEKAKGFLEESGCFRVLQTRSIPEALEKIKLNSFDVVISEHITPGTDEIALLKEIRASGSNIPFIILSGEPGEDAIIEALNNGADYYMKEGENTTIQFTRLKNVIIRSVEQKHHEKKTEHLNHVIHAIRTVNHVIVRESDQQILIDMICETLIENNCYHHARIVLLNPSKKIIKITTTGTDNDAIPGYNISKPSELTDCSKKILEKTEITTLNKPCFACKNCHLSTMYEGTGTMSIRLEHDGRIYGILSVSTPSEFLDEPKERLIFEELARDIAFALNNCELKKEMDRALMALTIKESRLENLLDTMAEGAFICDRHGSILHKNTMARQIFADNIPGQIDNIHQLCILPLLHHDNTPMPPEEMPTIIAIKEGRGTRNVVAGHPQEDGTTSWVKGSAMPFVNCYGEIDGCVCTFSDITEQKLMQEKARESEERLNLALEGANLALWDWDLLTGKVTHNDQCARMIGYEPHELKENTKAWHHQVHPYDRKAVNAKISDLLNGKKSEYAAEYRVKCKNGEWKWIFDSGKVTKFDKTGKPRRATGITMDISEINQTEECLKEANKKLNLLASITRHDILNQTMAIEGYLSLLGDMIHDETRARQFIEKIQAVARTIQCQINFTREYQEIGVNAPEWQSLEEMMKRASAGVRADQVHISIYIDFLHVYADPMLEKIFFNLFENAIRHGEHVTRIEVSAYENKENLFIVVKDNGAGVAASDKIKIFRKGVGKNTGFGLFMAKQVLAITGMSITEVGQEGTGAEFRIEVPGHCWKDGNNTHNTGFPAKRPISDEKVF